MPSVLSWILGTVPHPRDMARRRRGKKAVINLPASNGLETIQEKLQEYAENTMNQSESVALPPALEAKPKTRSKPVIDRCRPIAQQCREALIGELEERLIMGIFTRTLKVKKQSVLLLHDFVQFGESSTNMQLSCYGCMPRLLDFLRVNEDNELLEIMGLIIVRFLVGSDHRLKQLFNRHGGPQLLLSMAQYTKGLLKQEVANTLKSISKVEKIKRRPMSAPVQRAEPLKVPDVWDHLQARWKQEDQVTGVLRQWIEADSKHKLKARARSCLPSNEQTGDKFLE